MHPLGQHPSLFTQEVIATCEHIPELQLSVVHAFPSLHSEPDKHPVETVVPELLGIVYSSFTSPVTSFPDSNLKIGATETVCILLAFVIDFKEIFIVLSSNSLRDKFSSLTTSVVSPSSIIKLSPAISPAPGFLLIFTLI